MAALFTKDETMTHHQDDLPAAARRSPVAWVSDLLKDTIIKTVKDADEITKTITETVLNRIKSVAINALETIQEMSVATSGVARTAIKMADESGVDVLTAGQRLLTSGVRNASETTRGTIESMGALASGIIQGLGDVGADVEAAAGRLAGGAVSATADVGGNLARVAEETVRGIVRGAATTNIEIVRAAEAAVRGAVQAGSDSGGDIGQTAVGAVQGALSAAEALGLDAARILRATLVAAVDTATGVSVETATKVREALIQSVKGASDIIGGGDNKA